MELGAFTVDFLERLHTLGRGIVDWRHDVDYDLQAAVTMAELERENGVRGRYYLRLRGPYSLFDEAGERAVRRIVSLGHEIGVHVDVRVPRDYPLDPRGVAVAAGQDHAVLQREIPHVTRHLTVHQPPRAILWRTVPGWQHGLGPRWRGRYISDSRGVWREDPEQRIRDAAECGDMLAVNLHAEWWTLPDDERLRLHEQERDL